MRVRQRDCVCIEYARVLAQNVQMSSYSYQELLNATWKHSGHPALAHRRAANKRVLRGFNPDRHDGLPWGNGRSVTVKEHAPT